jgi:sialate O-acetylesterase
MMLQDPVDSKEIQLLDTNYYNESNWNGSNNESLEELCRQYCHEDPGYSREILAQTVETLDENWLPYLVPGYWTLRRIAGNGAVWISKKVQIPASWQNKNVELHIGGVDKHDISFFNGHEVGRTGSGFDCTVYEKNRCYQIPADLIKAGEENSVAIRAYSFIYGGGFNGNAENYYLSCGDERVELGSQWYYRVEVDFGEVVIDRSHFYGRGNPNTPGILFDGQIAPLIPYAIRGAIWYQGESDSDFNAAPHYADQMQNMINDWRFRFGCGDFAFYQVQLAGYTEIAPIMDKCGWAYLRESQQIACDKMNGVGLISAIDIGEE